MFLLNFLAMILTVYIFLNSESGKKVIPLTGIALLFAFHCLYFRWSCTQCSLQNPICVAEISLFWIFVLTGVFITK